MFWPKNKWKWVITKWGVFAQVNAEAGVGQKAGPESDSGSLWAASVWKQQIQRQPATDRCAGVADSLGHRHWWHGVPNGDHLFVNKVQSSLDLHGVSHS